MILIRFSLEWDALSCAGQRPSAQEACCRRIVSIWAPHGILVVLGGEDGRRKFLAAIESLPQEARKLWKEAAKRLGRRIEFVDATAIEAIASPVDLARIAGHVRLVGADDDRCELLGLSIDELYREIDGHEIEVSRINCIDQTGSIQAARRVAVAEITSSDNANEIWQSRFAPLLPWIDQLVIVDRYCGIDAANRRRSRDSGLEFILRRVWCEGISIKVFMAEPTKRSKKFKTELNALRGAVGEIVNRLSAELGPRKRELILYRAEDRVFGDVAHDRYVRCGAWVCKMDVGLEPFSGSAPWRARSGCELNFCSADTLQQRQKLEAQLERDSVGVLV